MKRRIFILFASLTTLVGFKPKREDTWHERWARRRGQTKDDYRRFYRATIPTYADIDDRYQALLNLHEAGKISEDTLAVKGGECVRELYNMEEHARSRADAHRLYSEKNAVDALRDYEAFFGDVT